MTTQFLTIIIVLLIAVYLYSVYVSVIQKRNKLQEAFSAIDVQLKKRYDLIPNILKIAQKFMEHEKELFDEVTKLRTEAMKLSSGLDNTSKKLP